MWYVERVRSTLKAGCDVRLQPKVVIYGPNGSGKTTIVQAMQLALRGFVTDFEGRGEVKDHTSIGRLFGRKVDAEAAAYLVGGDEPEPKVLEFTWSMARTKTGFRKPVAAGPKPHVNVAFPVQEVMARLRGSAESVAAWLSSQAFADAGARDGFGLVAATQRKAAKDYATGKKTTDLLVLAAEAKKEATACTRQATEKKKTADRLGEGLASPLSDEDKAELAAEESEIREELATLLSAPEGPKPPQAEVLLTSAQAAQLQSELEALAARAIPIVHEYQALPEPAEGVQEAADMLAKARSLINQHRAAFGDAACVVCGNNEPGRIVLRDTQLEATESRLAESLSLARRRSALKTQGQILVAKVNEKQALLERATVWDPPAPQGPSPEAVERRGQQNQRLREITRVFAEDKANANAWGTIEALQIEAEQLTSRSDKLKALAGSLRRAGKKQLAQAKAALEHSTSQYMPGLHEVGIDIEAGRVSLLVDEEFQALGGAQESQVFMALAAREADGSTPAIFFAPDRGWDPDTLEETMEALVNVPAQIIIMSTVKPEFVEGWQILDLTNP